MQGVCIENVNYRSPHMFGFAVIVQERLSGHRSDGYSGCSRKYGFFFSCRNTLCVSKDNRKASKNRVCSTFPNDTELYGDF